MAGINLKNETTMLMTSSVKNETTMVMACVNADTVPNTEEKPKVAATAANLQNNAGGASSSGGISPAAGGSIANGVKN